MPLTLIPTPIGNLEDITLRALRVLKASDIIACEDTRTSSVLLKHYEIQSTLVPFHLHDENRALPHLLNELRKGKNIAVISDAGTPGISDPGWILLKHAMDEGLPVDVLPGPSALLPAVLLSGLIPHPFLFFGFLPEKQGERKNLFETVRALPWTLCFYISPHKAERQILDMIEVLGDRKAALVREISKIYQESLRGTLSEIEKKLAEGLKGEMVLVVQGQSQEANAAELETQWQSEAERLLESGETVKTIVQVITEKYPVAKNLVKQFVIRSES